MARAIRRNEGTAGLERVEELVLRVGPFCCAMKSLRSSYVLDGKLYSVEPNHEDLAELGDYFEFLAEYKAEAVTLPWRRAS